MNHFFKVLIISMVSSLLMSTASFAATNPLDNREALQGLKTVEAIYDIRKSNPKSLLGYLKAIESNHDNLVKEGVTPQLRIIFISSAVQFITTEPADSIALEYSDTLEQIAQQISKLQSLGIKMEVCSGATSYFNIDNATILPGIKPVRSGFLSVMGWQSQGYALVPVY